MKQNNLIAEQIIYVINNNIFKLLFLYILKVPNMYIEFWSDSKNNLFFISKKITKKSKFFIYGIDRRKLQKLKSRLINHKFACLIQNFTNYLFNSDIDFLQIDLYYL